MLCCHVSCRRRALQMNGWNETVVDWQELASLIQWFFLKILILWAIFYVGDMS